MKFKIDRFVSRTFMFSILLVILLLSNFLHLFYLYGCRKYDKEKSMKKTGGVKTFGLLRCFLY